MKEMLWIEDIVESTQAPPFFTNSKTWLVLWILTSWLLKGMHFQPFQLHETKVNQKVG
jgi:hypothetical protein